ncbi:hypothetical protein D3C71_1945470 [compost metagenome]
MGHKLRQCGNRGEIGVVQLLIIKADTILLLQLDNQVDHQHGIHPQLLQISCWGNLRSFNQLGNQLLNFLRYLLKSRI